MSRRTCTACSGASTTSTRLPTWPMAALLVSIFLILAAAAPASWAQAPAASRLSVKVPSQPAMPVAIARSAYPDAVCNDGSRARYYFRPTDRADHKKKWLIVFQGGGACYDNTTCVERWLDTTQNKDFIGSHDNMVGDGSAAEMVEFDGKGILDEDGDSSRNSGDNPFRHFNKVHVHYCSSDSWKGRGGAQTMRGLYPDGQPLSMRIVFHGADIAAAVVDIVKKGLVRGGGTGNPAADEIPDSPSSEVVLYGQSAGAAGLTSQLDAFAAVLTYPWGVGDGGPKVWGIIDSNEVVGLPLFEKDRQSWPAANYWSGAKVKDPRDWNSVLESKLAFDESCVRSYLYRYPDYLLCNNPSRLLLEHITTPTFVVENAHDGVIHEPYQDTFSDAEIRAAITGGAHAFPQWMGLYIPNFSKKEHVVGMTNGTFLAADSNSLRPPRMERGIGPLTRVSMASALACYRDQQNGVTNSPCRHINQTAR